jgi:hypothetical protein
VTLNRKEVIAEAKKIWGPDQTWTTSYFFKAKLFDFFEPKALEKVLEVSGGRGSTTRILSYVFKQVTYVEHPHSWDTVAKEAIEKNHDRENIIYKKHNVYKEEWDYEPQDCIFIDCNHNYDWVFSDIENSLRFLKPSGYLVLHDYSLNTRGKDSKESPIFDVRRAVHTFVNAGELVVVHYLGFDLEHPEGVICMKGKYDYKKRDNGGYKDKMGGAKVFS